MCHKRTLGLSREIYQTLRKFFPKGPQRSGQFDEIALAQLEPLIGQL
jgi:hypothetical protein